MRNFFACLVLLVGFVSFAVPVHAQSGDEHIISFDSATQIARDGTARIRETIVYDFAQTHHHGIYRDIPIDYQDGETKFYIKARYNLTVDENGHKVNAETSEVDGNLRLILGDPDKTITGIHTYIITYTLSPVVMQKDGRPFLNLDVLGGGWPVPTSNFSASVSLENGQQLSDVKWYGIESSTPQVVAQNIAAHRPITINAYLPSGYTTNFLEPNKERPFDIWEFLADFWPLIAIIIGAIGAAVFVWLRWLHAHRLRKSQTIVPEYEAPKGMTPAEVGLLDDDSTDMREITATVIDWAIRGFLKITLIEKKGWFGSKDYKLNSLKSSKQLPEVEQKLYDAFFSQGKEVLLKSLDKTKMAAAVSEYKTAINKQLATKGYYDEHGNIIEKGNLTESGAKQWAKVEGFQMYMGVAEKDRLNFSDAPDKTPERFNKLLPFAVALGVEKEWAKQFEGIDMSQSASWYNGNLATFSAFTLANDIGASFAPVVSSNSSVSSSGGSSGGGVGGGGGGSW